METTTQKREKVKPERKCRIVKAGAERVLVITTISRGPRIGERIEVDHYRLRRILTDYGHGFELLKLKAGSEPYHIHLDDALGDTCECKGYLKWGKCRHASALRAKHNDGCLKDIPAAPVPTPATAAAPAA